ncbi:hypothetical protein OG756_13725 [Streptomyces sp. NBC_01310]|uniref:hypothetical protein n=1 Tax=Streptomyces sp. NBC_01310 TaxID=2903820 RepID=UPI0035B5833D|nr:hypothetical protein OG756_13725 [Streptomyces sp. NBC_01310]
MGRGGGEAALPAPVRRLIVRGREAREVCSDQCAHWLVSVVHSLVHAARRTPPRS